MNANFHAAEAPINTTSKESEGRSIQIGVTAITVVLICTKQLFVCHNRHFLHFPLKKW